MVQNDQNDLTKERILNEAEVLFAQKGYKAVSVREITGAANCNQAAVNYYFGSKHNLYLEVFRSRWVPRAMRVRESIETSLSGIQSPSPTQLVRAIAKAFLQGPLTDEERLRHHQLMARELAEPTEAFDFVVNQVMRPNNKEFRDRLRPFMPEGFGEDRLKLNVMSILAMVIHFNFARSAVSRLIGREYDQSFKDFLVEHITEFALKGLNINEKEIQR